MKNPFIVSFTLGLLMMSTALLSKVMSPVSQMNKLQDKLHLETMIPREFASWKTDQSASAMVVNPDGQGLLNKIYHQTLSAQTELAVSDSDGHHIWAPSRNRVCGYLPPCGLVALSL